METDAITTLANVCRRLALMPSPDVLFISVKNQSAALLTRKRIHTGGFPLYSTKKIFNVSTSRFGVGQLSNSFKTPLGLHRIVKKIGGGLPSGATFRGRKFTSYTWRGDPHAPIAHRILWLDGLEPGYNRDSNVDSYSRYIYIHGVGNETTLGHPSSQGCIHMAASDLLPLYDQIPLNSLVLIGNFPLLTSRSMA